MKDSTRKRSLTLSLILVGATGCSLEDSRPVQRDVYNSYAECQADWGDDSACEPNVEAVDEKSATSGTSSSTSGSGYRYRSVYYGPTYDRGYRPTTIQTSRGTHNVGRTATETRSSTAGQTRHASSVSHGGRVSRGGFGSSARGSGASS